MSSRCVTGPRRGPQTPQRDTGCGDEPPRWRWDALGAADGRGCVLQVCGALEVIHSLLKGSPAQEQLFAFLFEPGHVELLFSLLVQKKFSDEVRERVFKVGRVPRARLLPSPAGRSRPGGLLWLSHQVLYKMLKYEKVPERSKSRLKLKDIGYLGLISFLGDVPGSMLLFRCLSEQVLGAGTKETRPPSLWDQHRCLPTRLSQAGSLVAFGDSREVSHTVPALLVHRPSQLQGPGGRGVPVPPG